jgi:hypothetical protein
MNAPYGLDIFLFFNHSQLIVNHLLLSINTHATHGARFSQTTHVRIFIGLLVSFFCHNVYLHLSIYVTLTAVTFRWHVRCVSRPNLIPSVFFACLARARQSRRFLFNLLYLFVVPTTTHDPPHHPMPLIRLQFPQLLRQCFAIACCVQSFLSSHGCYIFCPLRVASPVCFQRRRCVAV